MKFPSLQSLYSSFEYVLKRFTTEIAFSVIGVSAAIIQIELGTIHVERANWCVRLIMVAVLGLALSLSATLFSESQHLSKSRKYTLRFFAVLIAFLILFLLDPLRRETDFFRFFLLAVAFHLLVSFAAFTSIKNINAFWQFNKTLFLRFLTGGLYSAVLFIGLAAAIGSMNLLFNFQFEWDTFLILWVCIAGLFNTVFFLSGIPENVDKLEQDNSYPKGLKIFTQYVLIPLSSVYVAILLAYEIKIIVFLDLPKGLVSNLILGYAVFGILSLLLIYPVRNLAENKWLRTYSKNFYFLLIPLIVLLIWAVSVRVIDYGITEQRYFLIVLALWLAFITGYFLLSKKQDIRVIPLILCLVTLLTIYGPQSAFDVSKTSQIKQLEELFNKNGSLKNNKITALNKPVNTIDRNRMVNILNYLVNNHGIKSIQSISLLNAENIENNFRNNTRTDSLNLRFIQSQVRSNVIDSILMVLNVPDTSYNLDESNAKMFWVRNENVLDVSGYQKLISFNSNNVDFPKKTVFKIENKVYQLVVDSKDILKVSQEKFSVSYNLRQQMSGLLSKTKTYQKAVDGENLIVPETEMIINLDLDGRSIQLCLQNIQGGYSKGKNKEVYLINYSGRILVK